MIEERRPGLTERASDERVLFILLSLLLARGHPRHSMHLSQMHSQTAHPSAGSRAVFIGTAEGLGLGVGTDVDSQTVLLAEAFGAAGTLVFQRLAVGLEMTDEFGLRGEGLGTPGAGLKGGALPSL